MNESFHLSSYLPLLSFSSINVLAHVLSFGSVFLFPKNTALLWTLFLAMLKLSSDGVLLASLLP